MVHCDRQKAHRDPLLNLTPMRSAEGVRARLRAAPRKCLLHVPHGHILHDRFGILSVLRDHRIETRRTQSILRITPLLQPNRVGNTDTVSAHHVGTPHHFGQRLPVHSSVAPLRISPLTHSHQTEVRHHALPIPAEGAHDPAVHHYTLTLAPTPHRAVRAAAGSDSAGSDSSHARRTSGTLRSCSRTPTRASTGPRTGPRGPAETPADGGCHPHRMGGARRRTGNAPIATGSPCGGAGVAWPP